MGHRIEKHLPARGMEGPLVRSCRKRNGANERESSTKGSTESLGILAQTVSTARHGATTLWGRLFGRTRENMLPEQTSAVRASAGTWTLEANLNRKANGLAFEGPFCGTLRTFVGI